VIYGVTDQPLTDSESRVNGFAHVNYTEKHPRIGILLCINGTGILYRWIKQNILEDRYTYDELNKIAGDTEIGSRDLLCYPYGNGAERSLGNREIQGHFSGINFNLHTKGHLIRAAQEGIVFSFRYGLDIMQEMGLEIKIIRAGDTNLFQSGPFREALVNTCNVNLEIYNTDGAQGAARGAGIGTGCYSSPTEAFHGLKLKNRLQPDRIVSEKYGSVYQEWKKKLAPML
jgi:xylulokinase